MAMTVCDLYEGVLDPYRNGALGRPAPRWRYLRELSKIRIRTSRSHQDDWPVSEFCFECLKDGLIPGSKVPPEFWLSCRLNLTQAFSASDSRCIMLLSSASRRWLQAARCLGCRGAGLDEMQI